MGLRISIAGAALLVVASCTAFDDVPEPKEPRVDSDHTDAFDATAPAQASPLQADASSDAVAEAAARTCEASSNESFCVGDVLHHCTTAGDNVLYCAKFGTRCVVISAENATCQ